MYLYVLTFWPVVRKTTTTTVRTTSTAKAGNCSPFPSLHIVACALSPSSPDLPSLSPTPTSLLLHLPPPLAPPATLHSTLSSSSPPRLLLSLLLPPVSRFAVRNLQLSDQTTFSMLVSWEMQDPNVRNYRLSYTTASRNRAEETVRPFDL